tara:strand:+ start:11936 stop:12715 length:780 start_codon:yes stop_codon:yes gene_type:complete
MFKNTKIMRIKAFALGLFITLMSSCGSKKDVVYFQNASAFETIVSDNSNVNRFKVDDVISINVSTLDPQASVPFNIFKGSQEGGMRPEQLDYIVDKNGDIDFPVLGTIKLLGLSPAEAKILLTERLKDYLKDPIINIRLRNFSVTMLGAVNRPGTYPVSGEQITILEALGLAGDLNIKGKRDNVMVIRDFNGTKVYTRIDLTTKDVLNSPVYYLTQNDVVYVEPNKSLVSTATLDSRSSIALSIASILITTTVVLITRN